jgi:nucleotide-binding universal stress UspA family protein
MITYKKILFPIDLSPNSVKIVPHVVTVAERFKAEVHLVYVAKTNEYYREDECEPGQSKCESGQIITRTVVEYAEKHCPMLKEANVVVLTGEPEEALLTYIDNAEIDLVVMATKGRSALGKAIFGSVAGGMIREAKVPIFFVRPDEDKFLV